LFPADFILEGNDQIRGWFNLLFVSSMIAMDKISFKAVYMHGFVNDALGRKMSKSLGNIISPREATESYGVDAFRFYTTSNNAGMDLNYNQDDIKTKYRNLMVLWNLQNYILDLSSQHSLKNNLKLDIEEKYILSKLNSTIKNCTDHFDKYEIDSVPRLVEELFLELSRTYIQLTRDKKGDVVFSTIYEVFMRSLTLLAPICPFITEQIYQNIKETFNLKQESIHHISWPDYDKKKIDENLENQMIIAKQTIQSILSAREKIKMGIRWPLKEVIIVTKNKEVNEAVEKLKEIIKVQTNIKDVQLKDKIAGKTSVKIDYNKVEPDFGKDAPAVIAHIATQSEKTIINHIEKEEKYSFRHDGKKFNIVKEHLIIKREIPFNLVEAEFKDVFIYLNKEMNDELEGEGYARELMRRIQSLRKKQKMEKKDKIILFIKTDSDTLTLLMKWDKAISEKVGAEKIKISELPSTRIYKNRSSEVIRGTDFEIMFNKK